MQKIESRGYMSFAPPPPPAQVLGQNFDDVMEFYMVYCEYK